MIKYYKVIENKIQCNHCKDIIQSNYVHDMKWCTCKKVAVDGGNSYLRRCFVNSHDGYKELSLLEETNSFDYTIKGESEIFDFLTRKYS